MATRRREIAPDKEKGISPSHTAPTKLRGTTNHLSKTNASTAPRKQVPSSLRPTARNTATDVSKQQGKKPASTDTAQKPTNARTKSIDKTLLPTQKTRVSTNSSPRSSSFPGKTIDSQKLVPGKNLKTATKDTGKHRLLHATPVSNVKKSSTGIKKKEMESSTSATKEQTTCITHEKVENPSMSTFLESETQVQDEESHIAKAEEKTVQDVGNNEKGTDDLVPEYQEPVDTGKTEAEIDHTDAKIVIPESSTVLEYHDTLHDVKTQDSEDKSNTEQTSSKQQELEEHSMNETNSFNKGECPAGHSHEEAGEEEVKEMEVVAEQETALSKKDEADGVSEAHESKETQGREVAEEKKQESENAAPKQKERAHGKKESAVSNDVIEETASKLREQRKNKVKALAGAFETVISLQENK